MRFILPGGAESRGWAATARLLGISTRVLDKRATWSDARGAYVVRAPRLSGNARPDLTPEAVAAAYAHAGSLHGAARLLGCAHTTVRYKLRGAS